MLPPSARGVQGSASDTRKKIKKNNKNKTCWCGQLCVLILFGGIHKSGYVELQSRPSYSQAEGFCRRITSPQSASRPSGTINTNYAPCQRAPVGRNLFSPGLPRMCAENHQQKPFRGFSLLQARSHSVRCSPRFLVRAPGAGWRCRPRWRGLWISPPGHGTLPLQDRENCHVWATNSFYLFGIRISASEQGGDVDVNGQKCYSAIKSLSFGWHLS